MDAKDIACTTKKRYPSRKKAKTAQKVLVRQGRRGLVVYRCWHCELYHLGHLPGNQTYKRSGRPFG